ncbi:MAG: hypothetical protein E7672_08740 [Ruminococcaceae bacterium]|nr:hypothetical protein [Oscillospiraceae bacterium]
MYDIFKNIWKTPTSTYTPMPIWVWDGTPEADEVTRQINEMHRKGVDGFILKYEADSPEYLSDEYFDLVRVAAEACAKRHMIMAICADGGDIAVRANAKLAERILYPLPLAEDVPEGEDILYRVWIKLNEDGKVEDTSLDGKEADGFVGYNLVLGYSGSGNADILNPMSTEEFIEAVHEKHHAKLSEFFSTTIVGFFTPQRSDFGFSSKAEGKISWSYGTLGDFFEAGGEIETIVSLLFPTKTPKQRREAEYIYRCAIRASVGKTFYKPLSDWCRGHGIALMGHPASPSDTDAMKYFDIPGQNIPFGVISAGDELSSPTSTAVKCSSDYARHNGIARCSVKLFEGNCDVGNITSDELIRELNFLFARG